MKNLLPVMAGAVLFFGIGSCSSSKEDKEGDMRRMGRLMCRTGQLEKRIANGDKAAENELAQLEKESDLLEAKLEDLNRDPGNAEKMQEIIFEEMEKCEGSD